MSKWQKLLEQTTRSFIDHLGVVVKVDVIYDSGNDAYQVNLECDSPGVLIGHRGEILSALQLLLGQHLKSKTGQWVNLSVNVNNYRQQREQSLHQLTDQAIVQVVASGRPYSLPPLPANERRIIHLYLADHSQVKTESTGVGRSRSVVISLKNV